MLEISTQLGESVLSQFLEDGVVCPAVLQKGIFTTSAVDNIDHNPSAKTATSSFHGTGISIFQHPLSTDVTTSRKIEFDSKKPKSKVISCLPESYTNVKPAFLKSKPSPPILNTPLVIPDHDYLFRNLRLEYEWLHFVSLTNAVLDVETVSWSAYHSSKRRGPQVNVSISSLLPLLQEQAHSIATIKHAMDKLKEVTSFLNPKQTPVMACDQHLFVLAKQIQWEWPEMYGEDKFVVMFGGLHIDMADKLLGDLLKGSGWVTALSEADVASLGTAESFLTVSNLAKTRQAHQITACCLYNLIKKAYQNAHEPDNPEEIEIGDIFSYCSEHDKKIKQYRFWSTIFNFELLVLSFVRSYRESDFRLYKESLSSLIPYFFALDHINYAQWLPIHLRDMLALQTTHPDIYQEFEKGNFAIRKTESKFLNIAIDQAHEQNNAIVKGDGGAIGLTEDPDALRRWMVAGPKISRLIDEFTGLCGNVNEKRKKHHEETHAAQKDCYAKVNRLLVTLSEMGNPFEEESSDLYSLDTKDVLETEIADEISKILRLREGDNISFYEPVKKNKFRLFTPKQKPDSSKSKLANLKDDCSLFSILFISCQSRHYKNFSNMKI